MKSLIKLQQPVLDSAGAQMLRIFQTYAIAKNWGLSFVYDPLNTIYSQVFKHSDESLLWNNFLKCIFPNHQDVPNNYRRIIYHKNHRPKFLLSQIRTLDFLGFPSLHVIDSPQAIVKRSPAYLNSLQTLEGVPQFQRKKDKLQIAIHIRQGEVYLSQLRYRYLPLSYFEEILNTISSLLTQKSIPFETQVFIEPKQNNLLDANDPQIKESLRIDPNNPNLIRVGKNQFQILRETISCSETPNLFLAKLNELPSAYETFLNMLSADILVMSRSSFSYLAGLLNSGSLVMYPQYWDPPLPTWVSTENVSNFRMDLSHKIDSKFSS
jgi:hypothetical protein